jgi:NAD(P)-dependent dehydrogenase (short-subunit alcohol dehydrogenase family)
VEAILASGDSVVATARKADQLGHFVEKYGPDRVLTASLDVSNNEQVLQVVQLAHKTFGRIDLVVNNAGYADLASIEDVPLDSFRAQIETNFLGVVNVTKAVLPILRQQGSGHILQVSSVGGRVGSPGLAAYQSAKWAVNGFSTVLAREVEPLGIKVTVLEPGGIKTDWAGSSMGYLPISEPYQQSVGAFAKLRDLYSDTWALPSKIADAILHISNVTEPPLRLLLGPDTVEYAKHASAELASSDEKWRDVTTLNF